MIYFYAYGSEDGTEVKLGVSDNPAQRKVQHEHTNGRIEPLITLATWIASPTDERIVKAIFEPYLSRPVSKEWFWATVPAVRDWLRWIVAQEFTCTSLSPSEIDRQVPSVDGSRWIPNGENIIKQRNVPVLKQPTQKHFFEPPSTPCLPLPQALSGVWEDLNTALIMGGDYWTPPDVIEPVRSFFGTIDLDPCSCKGAQRTVRASRYIGMYENGLLSNWSGSVWVNPPYSEWDKWRVKLSDELRRFRIDQAIISAPVQALTAAYMSTALLASDALCIWTGRPQFYGPHTRTDNPEDARGAWQGMFLLYFGPSYMRFVSHFSENGVCYPSPKHTIERPVAITTTSAVDQNLFTGKGC